MKFAYAGPDQIIKLLRKEDEDLQVDWAEETLIFLALATHAAEQLEGTGYDLRIGNRPILLNTLERAWREALYVRKQKVPPKTTTNRNFRIDRFGRPKKLS